MKMFPTKFEDLSIGQLAFVCKELGLPCATCGWNETTCDLHHILARKDGGTDVHSNLTHICPNCHRKAHEGKLKIFTSLSDQVGDEWKEIFQARRLRWRERLKEAAQSHMNISKHNAGRKLVRDEHAVVLVGMVREANIDFSKFGWAKRAASIVGIAPQKVRGWLSEYAPDLVENAFQRK
jgi:hypothetical protein